MFEDEYETLYRKQLAESRGQRREMLEEDLTGTRLMLEVLHPVLGTLDGIVLEHEMISLSGVKIYGDAFIERMGVVLEEEHFITHAEMVTRKRFSFERARARSVAVFGYFYFPYSRDELLQRPEACRQDFQQFMQSRAGVGIDAYLSLSAFEREALRTVLRHMRPILLAELAQQLGVEIHTASKIARSLVLKELYRKVGGGERRCHAFELSDRGRRIVIGN